MAKIAEYLKQILSARYGRDVRQSIYDAISAINDESMECWATVEKVPETLAIAAVKNTVSGKDITLEMSSDFVLTDFKAWGNTEQNTAGASPTPDYPQEIESVVLSEIRTCWKNLFDITTLTPRNSSQGGKITFNDDTAEISSNNQSWAICYSDVIKVKTGTSYTFKFKISNYSATTDTYFSLISEENVSHRAVFYINGDGDYEIPVTARADTLKVGICSNATSENVENTFTLSEAQFEYDTATDYEPYTESVVTLSEPIMLNGLDDVQDYVDMKRGIEHYKISKAVFDGTQQPSSTTELGTVTRYSFPITPKSISTANGLCDKLRYVANYSLDEEHFYVQDGFAWIFIKTSRLTDGISSYLASEPITVSYVLAEPIETPLPDADVEALKNIQTFKGITHVFTDSEVKPDMEVEYVIDTKMYIDKKIAELA